MLLGEQLPLLPLVVHLKYSHLGGSVTLLCRTHTHTRVRTQGASSRLSQEPLYKASAYGNKAVVLHSEETDLKTSRLPLSIKVTWALPHA